MVEAVDEKSAENGFDDAAVPTKNGVAAAEVPTPAVEEEEEDESKDGDEEKNGDTTGKLLNLFIF